MMSGSNSIFPRPLLIPGRDQKLPSLPLESLAISPPPSPPKNTINIVLDTHSNDGPQLPPIPSMASLGFDLPQSPATPVSPAALSMSFSSPASPIEKTKKSSPLTDLIESEKIYVEYLTGIIRRVAAAWSRSNLPPPELDVMFRSVESVYKTNRTLLAKLKEIGSNPSSPKALGDLLMRWIDDLDRPYTTYCQKFATGFDQWEPVKSNIKLPGVLEAFSAANPPSIGAIQSSQLADPSLWTLDALFLLPKGRLLYYRKLYNRLLKSTTPGRSDHRLLTGALEKLDYLLETLEGRSQSKVGGSHSASSSALPPVTLDVKNEPTTSPPTSQVVEFDGTHNQLLSGQFGGGSASANTSIRGSGSSSGERVSRETEMTSISRYSTTPMPTSIADLEKRLATDTTLDIFTMEPKLVRLQMSPPTLPYTRELKLSASVVVRFTPQSTGVDVVHQHGFVYVLSDLFLICEKMTLGNRVAAGVDGPDVRLCYPPLSGKVLKVTEVPDQDNALQISIMRKETLILEANSTHARDEIIKEFKECIAFARTMSGTASEPVPPLPKGLPVSPVADFPSTNEGFPSREKVDDNLARQGVPQEQNFAPRKTSLGHSVLGQVVPGNGHISPSGEGVGMLQTQSLQGAQRTPSLHNAPSGVSYPARKSSTAQIANATHPPPSSFGLGQPMSPARSVSVNGSSHSLPDQDPGMGGAPNRIYSPPPVQGYTQQPPLHHQPSVHSLHHTSMHSLHHQPSLNLLHQRPSIHQHLRPPHSAPPQPQSINFPQQPIHAQPFPSRPTGPGGPPHGIPPPRPPSEPQPSSGRLQKSASSRSLHSQYEYGPGSGPGPAPPLPSLPGGLPIPSRPYAQRADSISSVNSANNATTRPLLPSQQMGSRANSFTESTFQDPSPPTSPIEEPKPLGPVKSTISGKMKCRVFHQQQHAQWKSLGSAQLTLYRQEPTNVKQLVVEADSKEKTILISTIVLTDGVERVGKTGVAIELSDARGARTGIIYMIQLRNEQTAQELFDKLLAGSDRSK
ncbi:uncharacterized protein EDB91DRAFT_1097707 [Suillus paluster]|uniref:uncharacterized protein n=1 Tax=Suillus paluster TaxID=48578 RepID=UPI001B865B8C|nr:uncharacterized protein EDB91DRAFT_1097707 [Suillus paluster]KAG1755189.1 hypothetical protein EDB91DRAFT_1097707 [Suillus paluster]